MRFLLDTNAVIALLRRTAPQLLERVLHCQEGDIALPSIVAYELYFGAYNSQKIAENLETLRLLLQDFPVVAFDAADGRAAGDIRAHLAAKGQPIGPYDVLIAGQARARDLTLVSNNLREFERVPGLNLQDWTAQ